MALRNSDAVLRTLVAHTIGEAQEIPMARVAQATIPSGVKAYLRANLRDRFQTEVLRYGPFSRVQPLSASTSHLHELFFAHAAEGYVYPRGEYLSDLENAAHFTENYVCRPRWTLTNFLFHDGPVISTTTLFMRLEYVTEYVYLPQLLRRMVTQKQLREISQEDCAFLIRQIDSAVVREHTPRELALLTRPIFDYFLYGAQHWEQHLPLKPILLFYEDKELHTVVDLIQSLSQAKSRDSISLADLAEMCDDYLTSTPLPAKPASASELAVETPKQGEIPNPSLRLVETRPEDPTDPTGSTADPGHPVPADAQATAQEDSAAGNGSRADEEHSAILDHQSATSTQPSGTNGRTDDGEHPVLPDVQASSPEGSSASDGSAAGDEHLGLLDIQATTQEDSTPNNGNGAGEVHPEFTDVQATAQEDSAASNGSRTDEEHPAFLDHQSATSAQSSGPSDTAADADMPATPDARATTSEHLSGIGEPEASIGDAANANRGANGSEAPSRTGESAPTPMSIAASGETVTDSQIASGISGDTVDSRHIALMSHGQVRTQGAMAVRVAPPEARNTTGDGITQISLHTLSGKSGGSALEQPLSARAGTPRPNLERMITLEQRKRFITVLCDRDADFYELIISRLNIMRTWSEAAAYIRELFEINSVDPFRDEAITFTDIVQQRFGTEEQPRI